MINHSRYHNIRPVSHIKTDRNNVNIDIANIDDIISKPFKSLVSIVNENKNNKNKFNLSVFNFKNIKK